MLLSNVDWSLVRDKSSLSFQEKIDAISSAYFKEKEESIIACILHLLNEGFFPKSKFQVIHNNPFECIIIIILNGILKGPAIICWIFWINILLN